jgi:hypothetical protein
MDYREMWQELLRRISEQSEGDSRYPDMDDPWVNALSWVEDTMNEMEIEHRNR